jgi:uncharacterized repeat protein (TIGR01451 family)
MNSYPLGIGVAVISAALLLAGILSVLTTAPNVRALPNAVDVDWLQLGHDAQRTNSTALQVNPPYCYTWKWYEVPIASRAQPVVANSRLFIGGMDGVFYARNATTGASLWTFNANSPIRHSAGVMSDTVIFSTHDGFTYALDAINGTLKWKTPTGSSSTAPLLDATRNRVVVASSDGKLTALNVSNGSIAWEYDSGAPILTSPSLSVDGQLVFVGNEAIYAIAINANTGGEVWRTRLQGQSLAERYPVVTTDTVLYRSQPLYFFHVLLHEGDTTLDQAGAINPNWAVDWANVKPNIVNYLTNAPAKQTFFALNTVDGTSRGIAPILYTYGNNDIPNVPVIRNNSAYVTYRPRHGIQTDGGSIHVSSSYDAELGQMSLSTLDIVGLTSTVPLQGSPQFRLTSDEPAMLSLGGNILWVDNWERLGGISLTTAITGQLVHIGNVSNVWPECLRAATNKPDQVQCGPAGPNPFFPLSGNVADPAYPFPSPRVTDGHARSGVVIANDMIYWRVIEGGLAGISHRSGSSCPAPLVYTQTVVSGLQSLDNPLQAELASSHTLTDYVSLDLTTPIANPPSDLVQRLRNEVQWLVSTNEHLMPFYLERGFSTQFVWPYDTDNPPGLPSISYAANGNAYWHDPGELLYTLASAYPYLDASLKISVTQFMSREMSLYPPLQNLPYGDSQRDWLRKGAARESYTVTMRSELNNWPPVARSLSALYAMWLWSKNTGDWSYAQSHWSEVTGLFNARTTNMTDYYSDIAGAIGYARLAQHFGNTTAYNNGVQVAVNAMTAGRAITTYIDYARNQYLDPRSQPTGWYLPVFYGLTPEVGLYLREQTDGVAQNYIASREDGDGLRWWYLTRAGAYAEVGETSYVAPIAAWSHFLAHAYIDGDAQETLRVWLDRPWGRGDLYSIQKIVATIQAQPLQPDFSASTKFASPTTAHFNDTITYTIVIRNHGKLLTETIRLTDTVPIGLSYVPGTLASTAGIIDDSDVSLLRWSGVLSDTPIVTLTYAVMVTTASSQLISNTAVIAGESIGMLQCQATIIVNGHTVFLPLIRK